VTRQRTGRRPAPPRGARGNPRSRSAAATAVPRLDALGADVVTPRPRTLADAVRFRLREDLLSGRFAPGTKLKLHALREVYGVGATPLREALFNLAADGLVTVEGQKGFRVAPISLDDLWDITRMRLVLEPMAVELAIENGDQEWEANLVAAWHRLARVRAAWKPGDHEGLAAVAAAHRRFHYATVAGSGSPWLIHFVATLFDHSERYRRLSVVYEKLRRNLDSEHKDICDACTARQADRALRLVRKHITRTTEIVASLHAAEWASPPTSGPNADKLHGS
jgi:GntR family transcriptional regulator, carbon starvation induced regulator